MHTCQVAETEELEVILFLEVLQLTVEDMAVEDQMLIHPLLKLEALAVMAVVVQELLIPLEELGELLVNLMHQDFLVLL
jgi:hypothetical protein